MKTLSLGLSLWAAFAMSAMAQEAPPAPAPEAPAAPASDAMVAPTPAAPAPIVAVSGTPVIIEVTQEVSSRTARKGDKIPIRLAAPVQIGDQVLLPAGLTGQGEVIDASPAGLGGRPGELLLAARYLDYNGRQIKLRGFKVGVNGQGQDNMAASATVMIFGGLVGALVQGGNIIYPAGLSGTAKLNEDVSLDSLQPQPAATAPASAAPAPVPTTN